MILHKNKAQTSFVAHIPHPKVSHDKFWTFEDLEATRSLISNPLVSELFLLPLSLRPQRLCGFFIIQMLPDLI